MTTATAAELKMSLDQAIQALYDFRTRAAGIRAILREHRAKAVPKLLALLDDLDSAIVWCAIRLLGDLGGKDVIPKLMEKKEHPEVAGAAVMALQKLGVPVEQTSAVQSTLHVALADEAGDGDQELLFKTAQMIPGAIAEKKDDGIRIQMRADEHEHNIHITFHDDDSRRRVSVLCDTGVAAKGKTFEAALRRNVTMETGALAVANVDGKDRLVIVDNQIGRSTDPQMLREALQALAREAGVVAAELNGK